MTSQTLAAYVRALFVTSEPQTTRHKTAALATFKCRYHYQKTESTEKTAVRVSRDFIQFLSAVCEFKATKASL